MLKQTTFMALLAFLLAAGQANPQRQNYDLQALVGKTGQMECWDEFGDPIDCFGTGQDGDWQAGLEWPVPRFTALGNGVVRDNLTGLFWLQDASCDDLGPSIHGTATWQEALNATNGLADGNCGLTDGSEAGDWRLPNVKELQSLVDYGNVFPAFPEGSPFYGVMSLHYWSSSTYLGNTGYAWYVLLSNGHVYYASKPINYYLWPVRGKLLAFSVDP